MSQNNLRRPKTANDENQQRLKQRKRRTLVPEDYDDDDFGVDYNDGNQEAIHPAANEDEDLR